MKRTKIYVSILLTVAMFFAMAVTSYAATTITIIPNPSATELIPGEFSEEGIQYDAYKIMDATASDDNWNDETAVSYTIDRANPFFNVIKAETNYFTLHQIGESTVYNVIPTASFSTADAAMTLAAALNAVQNKGTSITSVWDKENICGKIAIEDPGYYLITSSLGEKLILKTLGKDITIKTKNQYPTLEKTVLKYGADKESGEYRNSTNAERGNVVTFKITVQVPSTVKEGEEIIIHDYMPETLTYIDNSVSANATHRAPACGDENCKLEFIIHAPAANNAQVNEVAVTFDALFSADAAVDTAHKNEANLTYKTFTGKKDDATVWTFDIPVFKYYMNEADKTGLAGAGFKLYKYVTVDMDGVPTNVKKYYNIDPVDGKVFWDETGKEYTTADNSYTINFAGLTEGEYYLTETTTPAGFNKLTSDICVVVDEAGKLTVDNAAQSIGAEASIEVENKTGTVLPETGGMGTTVFLLVGSITVLFAAVLLVARKKTAGYHN